MRFFGSICMMGAMALLVSSCMKTDEKADMTIGLPTFEEVNGEPNEVDRLYVDFADGNKFKWNANDEVMVYNLDAANGENTVKAVYSTNAAAEGQTTAHFTGDDMGDKMDHFFFFYPASKVNTEGLDHDNYETFTVPAEQTYTLVNGNPTVDPNSLAAACEVNSIGQALTLKHIFGICRLKLKGTKTVSSIVLHDNAYGLAGQVSMKLHAVQMGKFSQLLDEYTLVQDGSPELNASFVEDWYNYSKDLGYNAKPTGNEITLNCPNGVQLNSSTQTLFYIAVRPGAFIKGFTITVNFTDGTNAVINNYANPKNSYKIKPGTITGFAPAQVL